MSKPPTYTFEQLPTLVGELIERIGQLEQALAKQPLQATEDRLLTRKEAADLLQVDLSTLSAWANKGKLIPLALGNRIYYRMSQINEALKPLK